MLCGGRRRGRTGRGGWLRHNWTQRSSLRRAIYEIALVFDKHELGGKVTQPAPGSDTLLDGGNEIGRVR